MKNEAGDVYLYFRRYFVTKEFSEIEKQLKFEAA